MEFRHGLRNLGIRLSNKDFDDMIDALDNDGDGEIDYDELVEVRNHGFCGKQLMDFAVKSIDFAVELMDFAVKLAGFVVNVVGL